MIDPYRNRTARKADFHVRVRPGADAALALGMMHVIIDEGLADMSFIDGHTVGFDQLRERVRDYPPERASELCDVPPEEILAACHGLRPRIGAVHTSRPWSFTAAQGWNGRAHHCSFARPGGSVRKNGRRHNRFNVRFLPY